MIEYTHTETTLPIESELPKLIRDKIPEIIRSNGGSPVIESIGGDDEYQAYLMKKLIEEARELAAAEASAHIVEETADVLEVVDAILKLKGITKTEVQAVQAAKALQRGGFSKRLILVENE